MSGNADSRTYREPPKPVVARDRARESPDFSGRVSGANGGSRLAWRAGHSPDRAARASRSSLVATNVSPDRQAAVAAATDGIRGADPRVVLVGRPPRPYSPVSCIG